MIIAANAAASMETETTKRPLTGAEESLVTFRNRHGEEYRGSLARLSRHQVTFECTSSPHIELQMSEVLGDFKLLVNDQNVYSGRAVVSGFIKAGSSVTCETTLEDPWLEAGLFSVLKERGSLRESFDGFVRQWQRFYKVRPDFKVLVADMQTFLSDLRLWLEQVEMGLAAAPAAGRAAFEHEVIDGLAQSVVPALNALFEKFELLAADVPEAQRAAHQCYVRRQIHPLLLCSPFAHRTYRKPLGYAGDYEMVNMIIRDPQEGGSVFAKMLNVWFISQPPAEAHRNRIKFLGAKLVAETLRLKRQGRTAAIFNLGCGPAGEVQHFLAHHDLCEHTSLVLLDFNEETLAYTGRVLNEIKARHRRSTQIQLVKKSVVQILKGGARAANGKPEDKYDFLYCAGLFDYLPDRTCKQLMNIFYNMLAPGGLLLVTNVDASNPICHMLDYVLEWHLIYRNSRQFLTLRPDQAAEEQVTVQSDITGVNLYLEVRKPGP